MSFNFTVPKHPLEEFKALYQGNCDGLTEVFPVNIREYGILMAIPSSDGVTYISAEQAKAFFGFSE